MPRIVWNDSTARPGAVLPFEIHYASPSEFLTDYVAVDQRDIVFVSTDRPASVGDERPLVIHIGFIGRAIHLQARVEQVVSVSDARRTNRPPGVTFSLLGPDGKPCAELRKMIRQLQQGQTYEAAREDSATTAARPSRDRQVRSMPTTLKIMLALKADRDDRVALAGDSDPQVIQFLLKNSKISMAEVRSLASKSTLTHAHLMTIAANRAWYQDDQIKLNMARNPRLPDLLVEPLLDSLSVPQLRIVASAASTGLKARRVAYKLLHKRGV
jgi:Tfp pilus assembly protein PilZ